MKRRGWQCLDCDSKVTGPGDLVPMKRRLQLWKVLNDVAEAECVLNLCAWCLERDTNLMGQVRDRATERRRERTMRRLRG